MLIVNGERVWVPHDRQDLVAGLQRMGIDKVGGCPLARLSVKQLTAAYCSERARRIRRRQCVEDKESKAPVGPAAVQLPLLPR